MKIRLVQNGNFTVVDQLEEALTPPEGGFYWIDADIDDLATLQPLFRLDELDVEDCLTEEEQRPKIVIHENHYFIVVNSIRFDDAEIFLRALNIFLGRHFILTITRQKINELRYLKPILWEEEVSRPDRFLYHLIDLVIDNYFIVGDRIDVRVEKLEEDILMHTKKSHLNQIIGLRAEVLWLKKMLGPQRDVVATLHKRDLKLIDGQLQKYFGDIYENALKIMDSFDTYRDLMGNLREAYQSSLSSRANEIMRVFTAITVIFMPLTFITGVYGMNFHYLPGVAFHAGFFILISMMITLGISMFIYFRKKGWI